MSSIISIILKNDLQQLYKLLFNIALVHFYLNKKKIKKRVGNDRFIKSKRLYCSANENQIKIIVIKKGLPHLKKSPFGK